MSAYQILSSWLLTILVFVINYLGFSDASLSWKVENTIHYGQDSLIGQSISPTGTIIFNLPIIEQNVPPSTPVPNENYPAPETGFETVPGTPTPTPIPVQTGSDNVPIVIGAFAIIIVILLAWFFIGYLPSRNKGEPT
ncbi:MAG: hypothetical protein KAT29_10045 [Anaerolineales bacterium]|nr:hypothetical protein [Anaerolineales bacterium]